MKLIIAEKSALAKQIGDAIEGEKHQINQLTFAKGDYLITFLGGHAMSHLQPEEINEKYKKWNLEDLPIYFDNWGKKVSDDKKQIAGNVKKLLSDSKVECVISAGDMDDEGQLLVDEMLDYCRNTKPVYRLMTADTTKEALHNSLTNLKDNKNYVQQGYAAEARSIADMVFGFNYTRLFTLKNGRKLNVGRVQTPTLKLVVDRDEAIENFVPKNYTELYFKANGYDSVKVILPEGDEFLDKDGYLTDKANIDKLTELINNKIFAGEVSEKQKREAPPKPYNLATLSKELEKLFGYTPAETMAITQSLRDNHNAISYNRSESEYLPVEYYNNHKKMVSRVLSNIGGEDKFKEQEGYKSKCFDDSKITLHFAIIPQNVSVDMSKMTQKEKNCYMVICQRYLLQFMGDRLYNEKTLEIDLGNGRKARAVSKETTAKGWTAMRKSEEEEKEEREDNRKANPITFANGKDNFKLTDPTTREKTTKPPQRYTEASLILDMCRVSRFVKDPRIKELLLKKDEGKTGDRGSIGTSATRDKIVANLVKREYLKKDKKNIISTELGRKFIKYLPPALSSIDTTALWYEMQEDIKDGTKDIADLPKSVLNQFDIISKKVQTGTFAASADGNSKGDRDTSSVRETEKSWQMIKGGVLYVIPKSGKFFESRKYKPSKKDISDLFLKGKVENAELYSEKSGKNFRCGVLADWTEEKETEKGKVRFAFLKLDTSGFAEKKEPAADGEILDLPNMWKMNKDGVSYILMKTNKFIIGAKLKLDTNDVSLLFSGDLLKNAKLYSARKQKYYNADLGVKFSPSEDNKAMFASFVFADSKDKADKEI